MKLVPMVVNSASVHVHPAPESALEPHTRIDVWLKLIAPAKSWKAEKILK
jgi:hypothetical protein